MNIKPLQTLYCGFEINEPLGNNAFSYEQRQNKTIWVAPLVQGEISDAQPGNQIVFSEMEDGIEMNHCGLKEFIYVPFQDKDIFIFDNHNHAFFYWWAGLAQGAMEAGLPLVHIDQHTDMRIPETLPDFSLTGQVEPEAVFAYTNRTLNVGNFIQPALKGGLFSGVQIIDSSAGFNAPLPAEFILDIDMDIFSEDMAYIDFDLKIEKIREAISKATFITIATSPFFMEQTSALHILKRLF